MALDRIGSAPVAAALGDPAETRSRLEQAIKRLRDLAG